MNSISVFCGSSLGNDPHFATSAFELGCTLAQKKIKIIYGGAKIGLMGKVADGCLSEGGQIIGVIPSFLKGKEIVHGGLTQLIEVSNMHERKQKMFELSEGMIALPGGFGTFDELFEVLTWKQLNIHNHPIGLLNVNGYFNHLIQFVDQVLITGFIKSSGRNNLLTGTDLEGLLAEMQQSAKNRN